MPQDSNAIATRADQGATPLEDTALDQVSGGPIYMQPANAVAVNPSAAAGQQTHGIIAILIG